MVYFMITSPFLLLYNTYSYHSDNGIFLQLVIKG